MLEWPLGMLLFDVEKGFWWPDWGDRPHCTDERREIVGSYLARKPRLIPLFGHRFLPETPNEVRNPVFSMYGFDTIYGSSLGEYVANEFEGRHIIGDVRHIPFWSDITEGRDISYAW